ncbi:hypothetical protein GKZ28_05240 [Clostridium chromiireducens]|uniref:DUF960 domain-containing protein n=1 Tax=Clostridium chromiireducens TaxID=225345 RepID=A0A964RJY9_9CLOT|nr:DUF960 family protein [Clostridium chromiireducens]MVX63102.1 hypothetical protein [Clostridium chromiireducens]
MFDKERYITRGIMEQINPLIYLILWEMLDEKDVEEKDYLQVFDLKISEEEEGLQEIIHTQEKYNNSMKFYTNFGVNAKVYVIDTGESETMFLEGEL